MRQADLEQLRNRVFQFLFARRRAHARRCRGAAFPRERIRRHRRCRPHEGGRPDARRLLWALRVQGRHGLLAPDDIADTYWMLHCQKRSAWTFELDLRPWLEPVTNF